MARPVPATQTSRRYSVAEARDRLPAMLHEVEGGETVEITRHGKPVAMVISHGAYARLVGQKPDPWEAYEAWRARHGGGVPDDVLRLMVDPTRDEGPTGGSPW